MLSSRFSRFAHCVLIYGNYNDDNYIYVYIVYILYSILQYIQYTIYSIYRILYSTYIHIYIYIYISCCLRNCSMTLMQLIIFCVTRIMPEVFQCAVFLCKHTVYELRLLRQAVLIYGQTSDTSLKVISTERLICRKSKNTMRCY